MAKHCSEGRRERLHSSVLLEPPQTEDHRRTQKMFGCEKTLQGDEPGDALALLVWGRGVLILNDK